ncbi:MAG TPA: hypothetical protein VIP09_15035 [Dehalococcoidia bacterium]|jgi:hypothetical protein
MLQWALLGIFIGFLGLAYIMIQGTRAALAWRTAADKGDLDVIRDILEDALKGWSTQKRPKPIAPEVWRGIQSLQLAGLASGYVRVSCVAASEYKMQDGRWIELRNPLQEGMAVTAKAADMLLYEVIHYRPEKLQIDVYTDYRDDSGSTRRQCVLSTLASRDQAREINWEEWTPEQIVEALGGHYSLGDSGRPMPIEPIAPPEPPAEEQTERAAPAKARQ